MKKNKQCPCNSGQKYVNCCKQFIEDSHNAKTAEQLMRARYTAYTLSEITYIQKTMQEPALNDFNYLESLSWSKSSSWLGLTVINNWTDKNYPDKAFVEFKARFKVNNKLQILHEISEFKLIDNKWYYTDGKVFPK